ncbi:prepilin peptidase [Leifsonia sp. SIMBA_070]|uniref:prepilin peptidase n=1 Tax=Leifsonia sp. SIMBA_070 TaxID=3085810 RepID=UPI00397E5CBF
MTEPALWLVVALGAAMGLAIGSFLNVVVYRLPVGGSLVTPPSACPDCGSAIRAYDNIPVLSWMLLAGRCRDCRQPISVRYPMVEALTGLLFVVVALVFGPPILSAGSVPGTISAILLLVAFLYLAAISVTLALIDLDTRTLPNAIVLPSYVVGAVLLGTALGLRVDVPHLISAAAGAFILFAFYLVLAVVRPDGMGFGDVKLAGVLGLYLGALGWPQLAVGGFAAFLLGGVAGIVLIIARKATRRSGIPFGPWMLAGCWLGILFGGPVWAGYLALIGLG